jgi:hypothetical protein
LKSESANQMNSSQNSSVYRSRAHGSATEFEISRF